MFLKSKKTLKNVGLPPTYSFTGRSITQPLILNYRNRNSVPVPVSHQHHTSQGGTLKTRDWKTQDWKTWDQIAGVEKEGLENAGTSCVWVAKCNIINVRGHVRVNVTNSDFADHVFVTWKV